MLRPIDILQVSPNHFCLTIACIKGGMKARYSAMMQLYGYTKLYTLSFYFPFDSVLPQVGLWGKGKICVYVTNPGGSSQNIRPFCDFWQFITALDSNLRIRG